MTIWTIYCHIHKTTGRRYIGLTKMTMMKRWNRHIYSTTRFKNGKLVANSHFPNAIRKYGPEAFEHQELASSRTLEDGNATEREIIEQYETRNPEKGFNLMRGGDHKSHGIRKNPWDNHDYRAKQLVRLHTMSNDPAVKAKTAALWNDPVFRVKNRAAVLSAESRMKISIKNGNRTCNISTKLKIAASLYSKRKVIQNLVNHIICKKHGLIPNDECTSVRSKRTGMTYLKCGECNRLNSLKWRNARKLVPLM